MMETYRRIREEMVGLAGEIIHLLSEAETIPTLASDRLMNSRSTVERVLRQLDEEVLRVAVVGSIKSGKSTFVNSLLEDEVTRRGAGVITSIVTRIRVGTALKATLYLKSWEAVNADVRQALSIIMERDGGFDIDTFDIRDHTHRSRISDLLSRLGTDQLVRDGMRNPNAVLLQAYLSGYDQISPLLHDTEEALHHLSGQKFQDHRRFTGSDALSVYLKDVRLEVPQDQLDPHVEIADCQGSDSPNPLHLAMIQDYLVMTHLIVYVVSSRTGLREADIRFLSMIRKMGIMDNILFVFNLDFNEHETPASIHGLMDRNRQELSGMKPDPAMYCFSCLYNLLKSKRAADAAGKLTQREQEQLGLWEKEEAFIVFSDDENRRFMSDFVHHLTHHRYSLLVNNHLSRLKTITTGLIHAVDLGKDLLNRDSASAAAFQHRLGDHHQRVSQLSHTVQNTLDGAGETIKKQLRKEVDRLFDSSQGLVREVIDLIRNFDLSTTSACANPGPDPLPSFAASPDSIDTFSIRCQSLFLDFRRFLDTRMAEAVNPFIVQSIKEMESLIIEGFKTVARPVQGMVHDAMADYNQTLAAFGIENLEPAFETFPIPDLNEIKEAMHLHMPPAEAVLKYSGRMRTEAVVRFNLYRGFERIRAMLFKASAVKTPRSTDRALRKSLSRVKRETEASLISLFKDYQENLKFQYLFKLTDGISRHLFESISDGFQMYGEDLKKSLSLIGDQKDVKAAATKTLTAMASNLGKISALIGRLEDRLRKVAVNPPSRIDGGASQDQ